MCLNESLKLGGFWTFDNPSIIWFKSLDGSKKIECVEKSMLQVWDDSW
jgi:hypothetical protein